VTTLEGSEGTLTRGIDPADRGTLGDEKGSLVGEKVDPKDGFGRLEEEDDEDEEEEDEDKDPVGEEE